MFPVDSASPRFGFCSNSTIKVLMGASAALSGPIRDSINYSNNNSTTGTRRTYITYMPTYPTRRIIRTFFANNFPYPTLQSHESSNTMLEDIALTSPARQHDTHKTILKDSSM